MQVTKYKYRILNFFYGLIQNRQLKLWEKMPRSQMRLYMLLIQNGNNLSRYELAEKIVDVGLSANRQAAKQAIKRGLNNRILFEDGNQLHVADPVSFVIRFGSVWDGWRILMIPTSILSIVFFFLNPLVATVFAVLTFTMIIASFVVDFLNTVKY